MMYDMSVDIISTYMTKSKFNLTVATTLTLPK